MDRGAGKRAVGYWTVVIGVFAILAAAHLFVLWVGWSRSVDVKGWWPFILAWGAVVSFVYAVAFSATVRVMRRAPPPLRRFSLWLDTWPTQLRSTGLR
jgi:drug/metabolite transporter (DMT)-like permease